MKRSDECPLEPGALSNDNSFFEKGLLGTSAPTQFSDVCSGSNTMGVEYSSNYIPI